MRWLGVGARARVAAGAQLIGFGALAVLPTLVGGAAFQVVRRAGNFAIARPTREVLFTVVPREDRYKAKSFIDTVVYRTGDQVGAWSFALIGLIGWGITGASLIAAMASAVWFVNSFWLGRRQTELATQQAKETAEEESAARSALA